MLVPPPQPPATQPHGVEPQDADVVAVDPESLGEADTLLIEDHGFAIIGDWIINAPISDAAFRVYSLLLRFGGSSGQRMPSRGLLARRLHRSTDSIDRALHELVDTAIVRVEHRHNGRRTLSNRYHVRTTDPQGYRQKAGGRTSAAPRTDAAPPAADLRHNPDVPTHTPPPPAPPPSPAAPRPRDGHTAARHGSRRPRPGLDLDLLSSCGINDTAALDALADRCRTARKALGQPTGRWTGACLAAAIALAVRHRGWPPEAVIPALTVIAADPATQSPARLAEAGPWWDQGTRPTPCETVDVTLEERLDGLDGHRPRLQALARAELAAEDLPLTRGTVIRRALEIHDRNEPAQL